MLSIKLIFFISAQLWRLTNKDKLSNKNDHQDRKWVHGEKIWQIPDEKEEGFVEDADSGYVLGVNVNSNQVELEKKRDPKDDRQIWKRSQDDPAGWFELKNKHARKILSAHSYLYKVEVKGTYF